MSDLLLEPAYGKDLTCLAGDCPENCCMEWIIDIDDATAAYYRTVPGEFGEELRGWMRVNGKPFAEVSAGDGQEGDAGNTGKVQAPASDFTIPETGRQCRYTEEKNGAEPDGEAPHPDTADARDMLDASGLFTGTSAATFALNGKNCPYLQEDGLCRLRLTLGYEHTSETCREHPFNTEEYEGFAERSPSVSCPEVVRRVFETPVNTPVCGASDPLSEELPDTSAGRARVELSVRNLLQTYPDAPTDSGDEVLNILARTRNTMLSAEAFDEGLPLDAHITSLLRRVSLIQPEINEEAPDYAFEFSDDIADQLLSGFEEFRAVDETPLLISLQDFCLFLRENLSILTDRWKTQLEGVQTKVFDCDCGMTDTFSGVPGGNPAQDSSDSSASSGSCTFGAFLDAHAVELSRLYAYYIYRYFLKAVNDCAAPVWAAFAAAGALVPAFLSWANGEALMHTAAWYSREIEHDSDNAEAILDYFRENLSEDWEDLT